MKILLAGVIFVIFFSGCDNEAHDARARAEALRLKQMARKVNQKLAKLGFNVDLDQVDIKVATTEQMQRVFDHITSKSRSNENQVDAFGPRVIHRVVATNKDAKSQDDGGGRLAFYDPNSSAIVFRLGSSLEISDGYLAHELAHAYQDQTWGLDQIWESYHNAPSEERFNIAQYVIEGHAEMVRKAYEQGDADDVFQKNSISADLGQILTNDCATCASADTAPELPYVLGMRFLLHQYRLGGWPRVEEVFTNLPSSTEQIIHPRKFEEDDPTRISLPEWEGTNGNVTLTKEGTMGEAHLLGKLLSMSVPGKQALESSSGWDGDIKQEYRTSDGSKVSAWRILFDRETDAKQLASTLAPFVSSKEVMRTGRTVDWIVSEDRGIKRSVGNFLSQHPLSVKPNHRDETLTIEQEISIKTDAKMLLSPYNTQRVFIGPNLAKP